MSPYTINAFNNINGKRTILPRRHFCDSTADQNFYSYQNNLWRKYEKIYNLKFGANKW